MAQVEQVKKTDRWVTYTPSYALNDELLFKFSPKDREGSLTLAASETQSFHYTIKIGC